MTETFGKGVPAPIQVRKRWVVERTNSWMNGYGKLRRCTERDGEIVDFHLYLAPRCSLCVASSNAHAPTTGGTIDRPSDA